MISTVQEPIGITGKSDDSTKTAVKAFQGANGLKPDGDPGAKTRKVLFLAYMDALCGPDLVLDKKTDFLGGGADKDGKGDFQGCGEFNSILIFSKEEKAA